MSFAFKKFSFFNSQELQTPAPQNGICWAASASLLFMGCDNGYVQALNERGQVSFSFPAHGHKVVHANWIEVRQ